MHSRAPVPYFRPRAATYGRHAPSQRARSQPAACMRSWAIKSLATIARYMHVDSERLRTVVAEGEHLKLLKTKTGRLGFHRPASQGSLVAMPLTRGCPFTVPIKTGST